MICRYATVKLAEIEAGSLNAEVVDELRSVRGKVLAFARQTALLKAIPIGSCAIPSQLRTPLMPIDGARSNVLGDVECFGPGAGGPGQDSPAVEAPEDFGSLLESAEGYLGSVVANLLLKGRLSSFRMTIDTPEVVRKVSRRLLEGSDPSVEIWKTAVTGKSVASGRDVFGSSDELIPLLELPEGELQSVEALGSELSGGWLG